MSPNQFVSILIIAISLASCSEHKSEQESQTKNIIKTPSQTVVHSAKNSDIAKTSLNNTDDAASFADVASFIEKRDGCDHFRGEEPYDAERGAMLKKAMDETCSGTDAELKSLRERYKINKEVSDKLKEYEENIEVAP